MLSLGLHTCSITGDPGEDIKVEVAARHFPCCWMRWSLNSHACKTKDSSGWMDGWIRVDKWLGEETGDFFRLFMNSCRN